MAIWSDTSDGVVYINFGKGDYIYRIDAAHIPRLRKQFNYAPNKVVAELEAIAEWWATPKGVLHERSPA